MLLNIEVNLKAKLVFLKSEVHMEKKVKVLLSCV